MQSTIQVDLDSLWTYNTYLKKKHVFPECDPVYAYALQDFLRLFDKYDVKATFFVIGRDAENPKHIKYIDQIKAKGHEIASHSMNHLMGFRELEDEKINKEIEEADKVIYAKTGVKPVGFRSPAFSVNEKVLTILEANNYKYDASVVPSFIFGGIMNLAHSLLKGKMVNIKSSQINFGKAPKIIYNPDKNNITKKGSMKIKEVPVSTSLMCGLPIHSSYVFMWGKYYFEKNVKSYKLKNINMNYLFHGIDLIDTKKFGFSLPFFGSFHKRAFLCEHIIKTLKDNFQVNRVKDSISLGKA
jgi:peptidoglycan/xylan/chitin deacetylase (PgdA/CDA1 family)